MQYDENISAIGNLRQTSRRVQRKMTWIEAMRKPWAPVDVLRCQPQLAIHSLLHRKSFTGHGLEKINSKTEKRRDFISITLNIKKPD